MNERYINSCRRRKEQKQGKTRKLIIKQNEKVRLTG